jgi:hypothetical protein
MVVESTSRLGRYESEVHSLCRQPTHAEKVAGARTLTLRDELVIREIAPKRRVIRRL